MDSQQGLVESVEADFGDSIIARDASILRLSQHPALGPPDLCWLQKASKGTLTGSASDPEGYYHHVLGRDVSNSAAVAAYFALLMSQVEQPSFLGSLLTTKTWTIQRGFYCCYDVITRTDVRCELCIPGGVVAGAVDATGMVAEVGPSNWRNIQVSAFLRAVYADPEMRVSLPSLVAYDPLPSLGTEASLTAAVEGMYKEGVLPGALEDLAQAQGYGTLPLHMDLALYALWVHWARCQRWDAATQFFTGLSRTHPPAAVYVAAAAEEQGDVEACCELLTQALEREPLSLPLLLALATQLLNQQQLEAAAQLIRRALKLNPHARPAWLLLARCCVQQRCYASALIALNVMPSAPMPQGDLQQLQLQDLPQPTRLTQPQALPYDAEVAGVRQAAKEAESLEGNRLLAYLHGAVLVRPEPPEAGPWPDTTAERLPKTVLSAVYCLLQDVVDVLGWESFLQVRSGVFLMHQEPPSTPRATSTPLQQHTHSSYDGAGAGGSLSRQHSTRITPSPLGPGGAGSPLQGPLARATSLAAGGGSGTPHSSRALAAAAAGGIVGGGATVRNTGVMLGGPLSRSHSQQQLSSPGLNGPSTPGAAAAAAAAAASGVAGLPPTVPGAPLQQQLSNQGGGAPGHKRGASNASLSYSEGPEIVAADEAEPGHAPAASAVGSKRGAAAVDKASANGSGGGSSGGGRPGSLRQVPSGVRGSSREGAQSPSSYYANRLQKQMQQGWASPAAASGATPASSSLQSSPGGVAQAPSVAGAPAVEATRRSSAGVAPAAAAVGNVAGAGGANGSPAAPPASLQASLLWLSQQHPRARRQSNGSASSTTSTPNMPRSTPRQGVGEVEDLTKMTSASVIAPLSGRSGITPQLWDQVFGPRQDPGAKTGHAAADAVAARLDRVAAISSDMPPVAGVSVLEGGPAGGAAMPELPRIRTRPLGEGVEQEWQQQQDELGGDCGAAYVPAVGSRAAAVQQQQQQQQTGVGSSSSWRLGRVLQLLGGSSHGCWGRVSAHTPDASCSPDDSDQLLAACTGMHSCSSTVGHPADATAADVEDSWHGSMWEAGSPTGNQGQPLGEGLEPTLSLLMRGHSMGSTPGSATPRNVLVSWGSLLATLPPEHSAQQQQQQQPQGGLQQQQLDEVPEMVGDDGTAGTTHLPLAHRRQRSFSGAGGGMRSPSRRGSMAGSPAAGSGGGAAAAELCTREADQVALINGQIAASDLVTLGIDPRGRRSSSGGGAAGELPGHARQSGSEAAAAAVAAAAGPGEPGWWGRAEERRLCARWLDELIIAVWHDLQAYYDWRVLDSELLHARGGTHAELVLGLVPADEAKQPPEGAPATPRLPAADWLRRGALAERLRRVTQARHAYRASVKLGFSLSGYMALLRLEAECGEVGDVLLCANMVAKWHQEEAVRKGQVVGQHPVLAVLQALGQLLQRMPVNEVKAAAAAAHSHAWVMDVLNNWARTH